MKKATKSKGDCKVLANLIASIDVMDERAGSTGTGGGDSSDGVFFLVEPSSASDGRKLKPHLGIVSSSSAIESIDLGEEEKGKTKDDEPVPEDKKTPKDPKVASLAELAASLGRPTLAKQASALAINLMEKQRAGIGCTPLSQLAGWKPLKSGKAATVQERRTPTTLVPTRPASAEIAPPPDKTARKAILDTAWSELTEDQQRNILSNMPNPDPKAWRHFHKAIAAHHGKLQNTPFVTKYDELVYKTSTKGMTVNKQKPLRELCQQYTLAVQQFGEPTDATTANIFSSGFFMQKAWNSQEDRYDESINAVSWGRIVGQYGSEKNAKRAVERKEVWAVRNPIQARPEDVVELDRDLRQQGH